MSDSVLKEFEPFFGGDQKGACMVQAMYTGTNYVTKPEKETVIMCELLKAGNYKDCQRNQSGYQKQESNDVHQDVADLIITTALFHRALDMPSNPEPVMTGGAPPLNDAMRDEFMNALAARNARVAAHGPAFRPVNNTPIPQANVVVGNPVAKSFVESVFCKWADMCSDARKFYMQNVALFARASSGLYEGEREVNADWVQLSDDDITRLVAENKCEQNADKLRVNLLKAPHHNRELDKRYVIFGANLPDVPSGASVWYTQQSGLGIVARPPADFLRQLYQAVYSTGVVNGSVSVGSTQTVLSNVSTSRSKGGFNLDPSKFVSAVLKRDSEVVAEQTKQLVTPEVLGDATGYPILSAFDNVYGKVWSFDSSKGQYYRIDEGNKRVYYDESATGDASTCYSTYLSKGNSEGCKRIIQCIIDGNSQNLSRCLDVLGNVDLWAVASDDVQKVDPDMVRVFLRKFGVQAYEDTDHNGVRYKVPMSFSEWDEHVVENFDDKLKSTIRGNSKLLSYIRGLLGVCRSNPSILNKSNTAIVARDTTPKYASDLNLRKYQTPAATTKSQFQFFADSLQNALKVPSVTPAVLNPLLRGNFSNVSFFSPTNVQAPVMFGGSHSLSIGQASHVLKSGSSSMFSELLNSINAALADSGIQLSGEDQSKLLKSVKELETHEHALAKISTVLISIVNLARFYGASLDNVDRTNYRVLKLSDLRSPDDVREYLRKCTKDCSQTIMSNMTAQQALSNELLRHIAPKLIREGSVLNVQRPAERLESKPASGPRGYVSF